MKELMKQTVGDLLDEMAERYPDHEAVVYGDFPFRKTYSQFRDTCNQVAKGLMAMGVKKGDHVAMWATNYPEWLISIFATAKIGAVLVTVNTNYKNFEVEYLLRQSDSTTLILIDGFKDANYVEIINDLCPELKDSEPGKLECPSLSKLKNIIYVGDKKHPGMFNWNELYEMAKTIPDEELMAVQSSLGLSTKP
jgi:fatty-acyl-CoA synthase